MRPAMHRFLSGLTLLAPVTSADEAPQAIQYARFRYTGQCFDPKKVTRGRLATEI
jgi:hypothetical protein